MIDLLTKDKAEQPHISIGDLSISLLAMLAHNTDIIFLSLVPLDLHRQSYYS